MARAFQKVNSKVHIFSDSQKGFIKKTNGCSEHGILLNELLHNANRNRENLVVTAIDFTNAFGSVPHDLIMSVMRQRRFPEWTQKIVASMYQGATSVIEMKGNRSEKIAWKRGVKQGCPLSPLLFNLCLEPMLQAITTHCERFGSYVGPADERIGFAVQAYADDVIFISREAEGVMRMLEGLERFVNWSQMEVNVRKCATASYIQDANHHRCSLRESLTFKGQEIPNLTLAQSLKYLGTAVAARRTVKLGTVEAKLTEMKMRLQKILESPLLIVQKIDALKTFVLPTLDFMMLNGDVVEKQLRKMDQHIRRSVDEMLRVRGLPIECHHASWRDGGLSYPSLVDRRKTLMIRSFAQMMLSRDKKIREAMQWFGENEREYRCIGEDVESNFLNWSDEHGQSGTASLAARTRKTCSKMRIALKVKKDELILKTSESEYKTKTPVGIGRFLTQKLIRADKIQRLICHEVHGASYTTLKENDSSNSMLTNIYTRRTDAFFRFVVVGRADCLPTPANLHRWFGDRRDENCRRCGRERRPTLLHILNECVPNIPLMTQRHNRLASVVRKAVIKFVDKDLRSEVMENIQTEEEGLRADLRELRPDMVFERRKSEGLRLRRRYQRQEEEGAGAEHREGEGEGEGGVEAIGEAQAMKKMEIIEFSCPYGYTSHGSNSLKRVYEQKKRKYAEFANELMRLRNEEVRVTAVNVSWMGAIYPQSLKDLQRVLRCSDQETRKLGRQMSETVILGSMEIWRQNAKEIEEGTEEAANAMIREDAARFEGPEAAADLAVELDDDDNDENENDDNDDPEERDHDWEMEADVEPEDDRDADAEEANAEANVHFAIPGGPEGEALIEPEERQEVHEDGNLFDGEPGNVHEDEYLGNEEVEGEAVYEIGAAENPADDEEEHIGELDPFFA
jgi:hypothetical protein